VSRPDDGYQLVPMGSGHITELMRYEDEMFGTEAWSEDGYRAELADTRARHYVAAIDAVGALTGWAGVRVVADEAEVLTIGVVPSARRRGIALLLLGDLLVEAKRRGAAAIYLEVRVDNEAARKLYEREGFSKVGVRRGYYEGGRVDAVVMRREL
jgi:ribosomal-protein-alanine N-acetyltransferase